MWRQTGFGTCIGNSTRGVSLNLLESSGAHPSSLPSSLHFTRISNPKGLCPSISQVASGFPHLLRDPYAGCYGLITRYRPVCCPRAEFVYLLRHNNGQRARLLDFGKQIGLGEVTALSVGSVHGGHNCLLDFGA